MPFMITQKEFIGSWISRKKVLELSSTSCVWNTDDLIECLNYLLQWLQLNWTSTSNDLSECKQPNENYSKAHKVPKGNWNLIFVTGKGWKMLTWAYWCLEHCVNGYFCLRPSAKDQGITSVVVVVVVVVVLFHHLVYFPIKRNLREKKASELGFEPGTSRFPVSTVPTELRRHCYKVVWKLSA